MRTALGTTDEEFVHLLETLGPTETQRRLGCTLRNVYARRERLEGKLKRQIKVPHKRSTRVAEEHAAILQFKVTDGEVLVGSDAHIWPGEDPVMLRAFVKFAKERRPSVVVLNGDVMDLPQVSRHPPIGWEGHPEIWQEIEAAQDWLHQIEIGTPRSCKLVWTLGNHDARFETRLATVAREYARLNGFHLKDYFPAWQACWRCDINDDVVIKHRFKGGDHATFNNVIKSGKTMVTGHLHSARISPWTDYNGTRYGVDSGCMANTNAKAFIDYTEGNPLNWRSAFAVLTFKGGKLLMPELVTVWDDDHVQFRGEIIKV